MKPIFILFSILFFNSALLHDPCKESIEIPTCKLEMTKDQLKNGISDIDCKEILKEDIVSYKIKFPRRPTQIITSLELNETSIAFLKKAKIGDVITVFDIIYLDGPAKKPILVKIVE